ncbi:Uncharacterised protein [Mycobacteroides abscessus subsp. abscessus]|nr:Uncharacterised protein [Mycobacteroides abscessus subsp. abscessus]
MSTRCRSNLAPSSGTGSVSTRTPGSANSAVGWSAAPKLSITWNSGCAPPERSVTRASTSCSKGSSGWAKAARSTSRTCATTSASVASSRMGVRSTSVLTNMPTSASRARSPRPPTGVPTTMSSVPDSRARVAAKAACTTMNRVAPLRAASARSPSVAAASRARSTAAPRRVGCAGRGRSVGSGSCAGAPSRVARQKSSWSAARSPGRSGEPSSSCCHRL